MRGLYSNFLGLVLIMDIKTSPIKLVVIIAGHHEGVPPWAVSQHNIQGQLWLRCNYPVNFC